MHIFLPLPSLWLSVHRTPALAAQLDGGNAGHRTYNAAAYFPERTSFFLFLCHLQDTTMQNHADNCLLGIQASHSSLLWPGPHLLSRSTFRSSPARATIWGNWALVHSLTYMHFLTSVFSPFLYTNWSTSPMPTVLCCVNIPVYYPFYYGGRVGLQFRVSINWAIEHMSTIQSSTREGMELLDQLRKLCPFPNVILSIYTCPPPAMSASPSHSTPTSTPGIISVQF